MSTYRYFATSLITGATVADVLPLRVTDFSHTMGGVGQPGQLHGTLDLTAKGFQSSTLAALEPRKTLLWATQDYYPIWAGVLWDWDHRSAKSNELPIVADELGSLFAKRQIRSDQQWIGTDQYTTIRNLIDYARAKTNGAVAQLVHTTNLVGLTVSDLFQAQNLGKVMNVVDQFCTQYAIEYSFDPGLNAAGQPIITLRIGNATTMGRPYAATGLQLRYPGNLTDYAWPRTGSASTNSVIAVAQGSGQAAWTSNPATHGVDSADLAAGYPITEDSIAYTGSLITAQAQIDAYADTRVQMTTRAPTIPTATVAGGQTPTVQQILLGDHATMIATSAYHPAGANGAPGLIQDVRILGWTVHPPGQNQPETTDLVLGGVTS